MKKIPSLSSGVVRCRWPQKKIISLSQLLGWAFAGSVLMVACRKDENKGGDVLVPSHPFPVVENVSASIQGKVVNEAGQPVAGAAVKVGASTANTDAAGYFSFQQVRVDKHAAFIEVKKEGYFAGSRTMTVNPGAVHEARIMLMERKKAGEFIPATGGTVAVPDNGGTVVFAANAIVNPATSQPYSGKVEVAARYLDPAKPSITEVMPGELRAIDNNGNERGLQSFAMMAVELSGEGGEKLQLANGKEAVLTFPIPAALQSQAPDIIPLWYFDEVKGLWKEEGTAKREGNNYIGKVGHFSYWNCDMPYTPVDFETSFKDELGNPMPSLKVTVKSNNEADASVYGYEYTDQAGKIQAKIPGAKELMMVVQNQVGTVLHTQAFTSTSTGVLLPAITINTGNLPKVMLTGVVKDCSGNPVANGFVSVQLDGQTYRAGLSNGNFALTVARANESAVQAVFTAYNLTDNNAGAPLTMNVTTGNAPAVNLIACGNVEEYVNIEINGEQFHFNSVKDSIYVVASSSPLQTLIRVYERGGESLGAKFMLSIEGMSAGEYPLRYLTCARGNVSSGSYYSTDSDAASYPSNAAILKAYVQDGWRQVEGSFEGAPVLFSDDGKPYTAKGTYKIKYK